MYRTLNPSIEMTPGSSATDAASWPCPTSTAITGSAPRSRSTWVNPPGRRAHVEGEAPRDLDVEGVEPGDELVRGAADVVVGARDLEHGVVGDRRRCLHDRAAVDA